MERRCWRRRVERPAPSLPLPSPSSVVPTSYWPLYSQSLPVAVSPPLARLVVEPSRCSQVTVDVFAPDWQLADRRGWERSCQLADDREQNAEHVVTDQTDETTEQHLNIIFIEISLNNFLSRE